MLDKTVIYSKQSGEPSVPITVRIDWLPSGSIKPLMYWLPDGTCYKVISQFDGVSIAFLKERGEGLRFTVRATVTAFTF